MDSSVEEDTIFIGVAAVAVQLIKYGVKRRRPAYRVNPYLQDRRNMGRFKDFNDMRTNSRIFYENFYMNVLDFDNLYQMLQPLLMPKIQSRPNDGISPKEKLAIVLEYFASGTIQRHMSAMYTLLTYAFVLYRLYRISKQHFGKILDEVSDGISIALKAEIPKLSKGSFLGTANQFNVNWNFPNCLGAIDGKHIALKCPVNSGSLYYNHKEFHSIILMGVADGNYRFQYLDIGAHGSEGDAGVFSATKFGQAVLADEMPFPEDCSIGNIQLPFYFVGDDAFPLHKRIMKPYVPRRPQRLTDEERVFNYRLSRARRVVEDAFGILCAKWLCLKRTMFCGPDRAQKIVTACCYLHNYLIKSNKICYGPANYADYYENGKLVQGVWRNKINQSSLFSSRISVNAGRQNNIGKAVRNAVKDYVNSEVGALEWQRRSVFLE